MNPMTRRIVGIGVGVVATLLLAALSRVPYDATGRDDSLIRLSWRTPGELVSECRQLTAEEQAQLPAHMRREEVCEGRIVPYRLRVNLDGREVVSELVRAAGAREDRPLYVYRELFVTPGEHRIEVHWEQERTGSGPGGAMGAERANGNQAVGGPLTLEARLDLQSREVALITYDLDDRRLVARGRGIVESASDSD